MKNKIQYACIAGMAIMMGLWSLEASVEDVGGDVPSMEDASLSAGEYVGERYSSPDRYMQARESEADSCCNSIPSPDTCCSTPCCVPFCADWRVSFRIGGFYNSSHTFRRFFGRVGALYGVQATSTFCGCFIGFINADYYHRSGRPCCAVKRSHINFYTGSIGICWPIRVFSCIESYVGIGAVVGGIRLRDKIANNILFINSDSNGCIKKHHETSKTAVGGVLKSGIIIPLGNCFCKCWFGELFCDYMYLPVHFEKRINIGGGKIGGGFGVTF